MSVTGSIIAGVGLAGSVGGAAISANAAGNAASDQSQAAEQSAQLQYELGEQNLGFQEQEYGTSQQELQPWLQSGTGALSNLDYLLGVGPESSSQFNGGQAYPQSAQYPSIPSPGSVTGSSGYPQSSGQGVAAYTGGYNPTAGQPVAGAYGTAANSSSGQGPVNAYTGGAASPFGLNTQAGSINPSSGTATGGPLQGTSQASSIARPTPGVGVNGTSPISAVQTGYNPTTGSPSTSTGTATGAAPAPTGSTGSAPSSAIGGYGSLLTPYSGSFSAPTAAQAMQSPAEQAELTIGNQQLQQSAAAQGNLLTGGTAEALQGYGENVAAQNYQNVYNNAYNTYATGYNQYEQNQNNQFNRLAALSGVGQTAASQLGTLGSNAASQVGSTLTNTGNSIASQINNAAAANASGVVGSANAYSGAVSNAGSSLSNLAMLNQLYGGGSGGYDAQPQYLGDD